MKKGGITSTAVIWRKVGKIDKNGQEMDTKHRVEKNYVYLENVYWNSAKQF